MFVKKHFITKRQITEMQRKLNVNCHLHPQDSTSVYLKVKQLQSEKYDPVLIYKPQADGILVGPEEVDKLPLSKDLFLLGIQTKEQREVFEKFSGKIVCIDSTFGTNQYSFNIITAIVPDEFGHGYPVGHLISNRQDELTLYHFFRAMKD